VKYSLVPKVPSTWINDDFCDCPLSGKDEPGTSACANGTFYCSNAPWVPKRIYSGQVGDGICDCCDGTDEKTKTNSTCKNTCKAILLEEKRNQKKALKLREGYIQEASHMIYNGVKTIEKRDKEVSVWCDAIIKAINAIQTLNSKVLEAAEEIKKIENFLMTDFGPQGAFYGLYGLCFPLETDKFVYLFCPHQNITQIPHGEGPIALGYWNPDSQNENWKKDGIEMLYTNGQECWPGKSRTATASFECSHMNQLVSAEEPKVCEYLLKFKTPAACGEKPKESRQDPREIYNYAALLNLSEEEMNVRVQCVVQASGPVAGSAASYQTEEQLAAQPLSDDKFNEMIEDLWDRSGRLEIMKEKFRMPVTVKQLAKMMDQLRFDKDRTELAILMYGYIVEHEKGSFLTMVKQKVSSYGLQKRIKKILGL